jgi:hypothetical protein
LAKVRLSAARRLINADAAGTFCGFAAVWTHTVAVVDKVPAVHATRQIFFAHRSASATLFQYDLGNLRFQKSCFLSLESSLSGNKQTSRHYTNNHNSNRHYKQD